MRKPPTHHNKAWTGVELAALRRLARGNTPTRVIALKLQRTDASVYSEASRKRISLEPTNQSPYNRQPKC
jgi:porphobilinogen deaminase